MISKEEIKESKQCLDEIIVNTYAEGKSKKLYNLQIYIQQLENKVREVEVQRNELATELSENEDDKQKLIDKVEEYVNNTKKEKLPYFKTVADMIRYKGYAEGRIKACEEILSIVKGENKRQ